jgi:hypothetical protein
MGQLIAYARMSVVPPCSPQLPQLPVGLEIPNFLRIIKDCLAT